MPGSSEGSRVMKRNSAVCSDGSRYRVYVDPNGRLIARKQ